MPWPHGVIEELPQVEAVIIGGVVLRVVRGSQRGHFVAIHRVEAEEALDLVGHHEGGEAAPHVEELEVHGHGSAAVCLAQGPEHAELGIRHAHLVLQHSHTQVITNDILV